MSSAFVLVPRVVVEELAGRTWPWSDAAIAADLVAALHREHDPKHRSTGTSPPWHHAAEGVRQMRKIVADRGPGALAQLDQVRGEIRDEFDKLDVSLHDETAIYHGLVWTGLVTELARHGYKNGAVDGDTFRAIGEIIATIGSALLEYVPKDVGRG